MYSALSDLPASRGTRVPALILALALSPVPALECRVAREAGMRGRVDIAFVSGYCSTCLA